MSDLDPCCIDEAGRSLRRHKDVAVCDGCGRLLLAYGNDTDYQRTIDELTRLAVSHSAGWLGKLRVIAKER